MYQFGEGIETNDPESSLLSLPRTTALCTIQVIDNYTLFFLFLRNGKYLYET